MGFFKNLFEKKVCDICGEEIGLLGNRKLEDGNCCKDCAKKLSPWFTERKHSTVEEIRQQLADREENRKAVESFRQTGAFGEDMKILVDEHACKFMVTRGKNIEEENPDVFDFQQIASYNTDIRASHTEVYKRVRDSDGNTRKESYFPPRYKYSYDFQVTLQLKHPYVEKIEFSLSDGSFEVEATEHVTTGLFGMEGRSEGSVNPPTMEDRRKHPKYARCEKWAYDLELVLLHGRGIVDPKIESLIEKYEAQEKKAAAALAAHDEMAYAHAESNKMKAMRALQDAYEAHPCPEAADRIAQVRKRYENEPKMEVEKTMATKYCAVCGAPLVGGNFCTQCGAVVPK